MEAEPSLSLGAHPFYLSLSLSLYFPNKLFQEGMTWATILEHLDSIISKVDSSKELDKRDTMSDTFEKNI